MSGAGGGKKSAAIAITPGARRRFGTAATLAGERWSERLRTALGAAIVTEVDHRRLFLWLPVSVGLGIVAYFSAETEPHLLASAVPLLLSLAVAFAGRGQFRVLVGALAVAAFFAGFHLAGWRTRLVAAPVLASTAVVAVTGRIESLDRTAYGARMVVRVEDVAPPVERMPDRIRVTLRGSPAHAAGAGVQFRARLLPPSPAATPGGFDFEREAYFQRLGAVGSVLGAVSAKPDARPLPPVAEVVAAIDRARNAMTDRIIAVVGGSTGAIAAALITGKRGQIAEGDNETWRAAGIYHLISISGLHMMLAAGLFFWVARLIFALFPEWKPRLHPKKIAALIAMAGATAYDIFSGSEVATERSLIMTLVMFGAILADRPALAMRNLAISALLILAMRPETVLGPSFQMSFGAVAALVAFGEAERRWRERHPHADAADQDRLMHRAGRIALAFVATSLIAGLATAPFQAFHFHRLNPYGVLGNALAVPLCSFIVMPAALIGVLTYPLGLDAPAFWVMGQGIDAISRAAAMVGSLSGAVAPTGRFGAGALLLMSAGLLLATLMMTWPFRAAGLILVIAGMLLASRSTRPDLILDASGRTVMLRGAEGTLTMLGRTRPVFALQQWLTGDRDGRSPRDASLTQNARCDTLGCTGRLADGRAVALVLEPSAFPEDCERAAIIVTPLTAPIQCWDQAEVYDRAFFRDYGATYITLTPAGPRLETSRNARIDRPWRRASPGQAASAPLRPPPRLAETAEALNPVAPRAPLPPPWDPHGSDPLSEAEPQ